MGRLSKDEYFLTMAQMAATRATCDRLHAGCVLVMDGEIIATGYNGAPSGMDECDKVGHLLVEKDGRLSCFRTIHAEINSIHQSRKRHKNLIGCTAYINATPCVICLSELLKYGIKRVVCGSVYKNAVRSEESSRLLEAWSATMEYQPAPEILVSFGEEVPEPFKVQIKRKL